MLSLGLDLELSWGFGSSALRVGFRLWGFRLKARILGLDLGSRLRLGCEEMALTAFGPLNKGRFGVPRKSLGFIMTL